MLFGASPTKSSIAFTKGVSSGPSGWLYDTNAKVENALTPLLHRDSTYASGTATGLGLERRDTSESTDMLLVGLEDNLITCQARAHALAQAAVKSKVHTKCILLNFSWLIFSYKNFIFLLAAQSHLLLLASGSESSVARHTPCSSTLLCTTAFLKPGTAQSGVQER